jgi:hypothetical protein
VLVCGASAGSSLRSAVAAAEESPFMIVIVA